MPEEKQFPHLDPTLPAPLVHRTRKRWTVNDRSHTGLWLGWPTGAKARKFGFTVTTEDISEPVPFGDASDTHLMTVAPIGAGKGVSNLIPVLLTYPGTTIVVDLKGEAVQVTARHRREMGHHVVVLDPFGVVASKTDAFNPLDMLFLPRALFRLKGYYRFHFQRQSPSAAFLHHVLRAVVLTARLPREVDLTIDIDPQDML